MGVAIRNKTIKYLFLLFPFFELFTLELFVSKNILAVPFNLILTCLSIARLLISLFMIVKALHRNIFTISYTVWGIFLFSLFRILSSLLNQSFYVGLVIGGISYIGFVLLCEEMIYESRKDFYDAVYYLLGFYTFLGVLSVWILPNGFFNAEDKAYAVYFLGSKNASYPYFFTFTYVWYLKNLIKNGEMPKFGGWIILLLLLTERICDSSNAVLCFALLWGFHMFIKHNKKIYENLSPFLLEIIVIIGACLIVFGSTSSFLENILAMLGRDISFSGRGLLWKQAINLIVQNPLTGTGGATTFILATGVPMLHAHCFYLDIFAKYGVLVFASIIGMISFIMLRLSKEKKRKEIIVSGVFVFIYLVHCISEDTSIYFLSMILLLAESLYMKRGKTYRK